MDLGPASATPTLRTTTPVPQAGGPLFVPENYFRPHGKEDLFPDRPEAPLELDLGCGDGTFLIEMAARHPERNFLGVERLIGRVERTARRITERGLKNARVLRLETTYTVGWLLAPAIVSRLHLLCPDPWPKKKHHSRRLPSDPLFLDGVERVLIPGGEFLLKSDDRPYYENALECLAARPAFAPMEWAEDEFYYAMTDFERQWLALSKTMHRARWQLQKQAERQ